MRFQLRVYYGCITEMARHFHTFDNMEGLGFFGLVQTLKVLTFASKGIPVPL